VPILGPGKLLGLLAHLTCRPNRRSRTDQLVELFWSDRDSTTAHHDLRQCLWQLRRRLGRAAITCQHGEVTLRAPIECDRDQFLTALERGTPEQAFIFYTGDFLPEGTCAASNGFEAWADGERYRLRRLFMRAAESRAREHVAAGRFADAQRLARRVRDADPDEQGAWALVLETLLTAPDSGQAAAEADVCDRRFTAKGRALNPELAGLVRLARWSVEQGVSQDSPTTA
jgi:DNA-binding SARP family transcriptional activator